MRSLCCVLAPICACLLAGPVLASSEIDEAQGLIDEAEYDEAARVLRRALAKGELSKSELTDLYRLQGTVMVALGRRDRAAAAFRNLILADPGASMAHTVSPKVRGVFEDVFEELRESGTLDQAFDPKFTPVGSVAPGADVTLTLEIGDQGHAGQINAVSFYYRRVGTPHYSSVSGVRNEAGAYVGVIPGFFLDAEREDYAVEYYVEAADVDGERLTGVGMPTLPLQFDVLGTAETETDTEPAAAGQTDVGSWVVLGGRGGHHRGLAPGRHRPVVAVAVGLSCSCSIEQGVDRDSLSARLVGHRPHHSMATLYRCLVGRQFLVPVEVIFGLGASESAGRRVDRLGDTRRFLPFAANWPYNACLAGYLSR